MSPVVTSWRDILIAHAHTQPDALAYRFLDEQGEVAESLTYAQLLSRVEGIAAWLHQQGASGQPVLLLYPPGLEFVCAFLGCLWAGAVAVPAYPPDPSRLNKSLPRLARIVQDCNAQLALTSPFFNWLIKAFALLPGAEMKALRRMRLQTTPKLTGTASDLPAVAAEQLAFLQYTSGSTGQPKGVMLSHGQILANAAAQYEKYPARPGDTSVFWLPVYHDMGLLGGVLQPLYMGTSALLISPLHFLQQPLLWLKALSRYRGVYTAAPNFALGLCSHRHDPYQLQGCDLSALQFLLLGGEPIRPDTLHTFAQTFAPYGFDARAFYPAYGLAEATVFVSGGAWFSGAQSHWVEGPALQQGQVVPASPDTPQAQGLVACGTAPSNGQIRMVDPDSQIPLAPGQIGEIWVQGPYVAQGYWNQPELSATTFGATLPGEPGTWLRTGDLGYLDAQGQLVVAGRIKDLIILRGKNYYPQDLEWCIETQVAGVRKGCVAAFALPQGDTEALGVVAEVRDPDAASYQALSREIAAAIAAEYGIQPSEVALIAPRTLPKTTSGKLRRRATATALQDGSLKTLYRAYLDAGAPGAALAEELFSPDQTHQEVLRIWQEVMEVPSSELTDHFFQQGGDSLKALTLASELEERFQVELPIDGLMEDPTPAAIARYLQTQTPSLSRAPLPALAPEALIPLTPTQQALLGQPFRAAWWLHGELDPEQVRRCLETVIAREATLRTVYHREQELPYQHIAPSAPLHWLSEPLAGRDPEQLANGLTLPKAGLSAGLWMDQERGLLALCWPAAHGDEASAGLLQKAFRAAWENSSPPVSKGSLAQFASLVHTPRYRQGLSADEQWWRETLAGPLPALNLPPSPSQGGNYRHSLDEARWTAFKTRAWAQRLTPATALLHAYIQLLRTLAEQDELLVSLPVHGRNDDRFRHSLGAFAQWLPLRDRGEDPAGVHQAAMALQKHGDVPLSWVLPDLQVGPDRFSAAGYTFIARDTVAPRSGALHWERLPLAPEPLPTHLLLEVWDGPTPQLYWRYSNRHSAAQMAAWAAQLVAAL